MSEKPIELEGLTKFYGEVKGVADLSFEVGASEVFGFLGPNGAGKSTTIRILLGLISPTSGGATLLGEDVTDRDSLLSVKPDIGYIPDDHAFYESMTGAHLLDYLGRLKGDERRDELLDRFPIPKNRPVRAYSSGNKQKLAIVQAFMHDPAVVIMDEPTSGLDPLLQNEFYQLIEEEQAAGTTCFFSSHILSEVRRVCDRVAIIRDGELVALEEIDRLLRKSGTIVTVELEESPPTEAFSFPGIVEVTRNAEDDSYTLIVSENFDGLIEALNRYTVSNLSVREASLDDVFMHFYEAQTDERNTETVSDV